MELDQQQLKKILVEGGYLEETDWKKAETESAKRRVKTIDYLFDEDLLDKDVFGQAMAEFFGVPYADLNSNMPTEDQIKSIPEDLAIKYRLVLFKKTPKSLTLTTDHPDNPELKEAVVKNFGKTAKISYSLTEDINTVLLSYRQALETRFSQIIKEKHRIAPEIVDEIFSDAITFRASDIHFEPEPYLVIVRFRIDGILAEAGRLPKEFYEGIVNRIKVKSRLRTDEHLAAQDGSMFYEGEGVAADMRVSIVPILDGEKIVIRLLSHYVRGFGLSDLGLSVRDQKTLELAAKQPFGMILVVGPTGSGKSTTLYALLKKINSRDVNITTIEDPVEYKISGINQIQVNEATNLTFFKGLRSIVRQDPDIIMVGEIRDAETTDIAINAALTGHLLLSTFHANDAATGIPRLLDMGAEPFLLSSTLHLIMAQRLARKVCENCRVSYKIKAEQLMTKYPQVKGLFKIGDLTLYQGKGCSVCHGTGYSGRVALFEIIVITPEMRDLIMNHPSSNQVWQLAQKQGSISMFEDGISKVLTGATTIEEVIRVATPVQSISKK